MQFLIYDRNVMILLLFVHFVLIIYVQRLVHDDYNVKMDFFRLLKFMPMLKLLHIVLLVTKLHIFVTENSYFLSIFYMISISLMQLFQQNLALLCYGIYISIS